MTARGAIHSARRARQLHDFSGLTIGKITPTDLDGLIDYHNESFAFIEIKHADAELPFGQQLALKRVVDLIARAGKRSALFVSEHQVVDTFQQVDAARTLVRWRYERGEVIAYDKSLTLRQSIDEWLGLAMPQRVQPVAEAPQTDAANPLSDAKYVADLYEYLQRTKREREAS